nr:hypothetical protein [Tanacetum cinerariifolium]
MESIFTTASSSVAPLPSPTSTMTPSIMTTTTTASQPSIPPTPIPSEVLQNLPTFESVFRFEDRVKSLEGNFSEFMRTNQSPEAVSNIPGIVHQYMHQEMTKAVREAVQIQIDRLQYSLQRENDEFLRTIDENMKKIIKEQVKSQVKAQVTRILPRIEESVNAQLEAEVLTKSSHSSSTSYARRREDDDDQEGPSAGSDQGSTTGTQSRQLSASESAFAEEPVQTTCQMKEPSHPVFETAKQTDARSSFNELLDTPIDFSNFIINRLDVDTLTPELLAGPTYELIRGSCNSLTELEYHLEEVYKATTDKLEWVNPEALRSFAAVINKCLTRKSYGIDSLRLSQAQILWGLYHRRNVDYAFLIWEDFVYQVEHNNQKKSNEMYYPRCTKVIIHHFMTKKPSIPRRNKVNWHYVRDDILFSTIKVVSRHQNTQQYGSILPIELTTDDIRNTKAYKEYYACATREAAPKPKASARRKRGGSASSTTPSTPIATPTPITTVVAAPRLIAATKGKQPARATSPTDPSEVERTETEQLKIVLRRSKQETHISQQDEAEKVNDDDDDEEEISKIDEQEATESGEGDDEETKSDGENGEDDGNGEEDQGLRISEEERMHEEEEADELYRDVDINQGRGLQVSQDIDDSHVTLTLVYSDGQQESSSTSSFVTSLLNPIVDPGMESIFTTASTFVTPLPSPTSTMTPSTITTTRTASRPPIPPTPIPTDLSEMELKKILIDKMEGNNSIQEDVRMMMIRKNPPLDQTEGLRDEEKGGASSRKYTISVTKTKAADYGHIKWIEDL